MVERLTRERRREMTRNTLLEAAGEVFAEKGFAGASLDEIAERAGYTRGALYKHFSSKEDLFESLTEQWDTNAMEAFSDPLMSSGSLAELNVQAIAEIWRGLFGSDSVQKVIGLEGRLYAMRNPEVRDRWNEFRRTEVERVTAFIDEMLTSMGITLSMPTETLARAMYAASDGIAMLTLLEDDADTLFEPLIDLVIRALATMIE